jgi:hypothetical protein
MAMPVLVPAAGSAGEQVEISADAKSWSLIGHVAAPGIVDTLPADGRGARYLRLSAPDAGPKHPLVVGDVSATERR